jgi:hypothetical protein
VIDKITAKEVRAQLDVPLPSDVSDGFNITTG